MQAVERLRVFAGLTGSRWAAERQALSGCLSIALCSALLIMQREHTSSMYRCLSTAARASGGWSSRLSGIAAHTSKDQRR